MCIPFEFITTLETGPIAEYRHHVGDVGMDDLLHNVREPRAQSLVVPDVDDHTQRYLIKTLL